MVTYGSETATAASTAFAVTANLDTLTASIASGATGTGTAATIPAGTKSLMLSWTGIANMCVVDVEWIDSGTTVISRWTAWLKDGVSHLIWPRSRVCRLRILNPGVKDDGTTANAVVPTCRLHATSVEAGIGQYYRTAILSNATMTATTDLTGFQLTPNALIPYQGNDKRVQYIAITSVTGTAPTLNITHDTSSDGTNVDDTGAGANITAADSISSVNIGGAGSLRSNVLYNRLRCIIGGSASPTFTGTYVITEGWLSS